MTMTKNHAVLEGKHFASLANQTKGDGVTLNSVRIETLKCEKETDFVCTVKTVSGLLLVGGQSVVCCRITNDKTGAARCIWNTQIGRTTMLLVQIIRRGKKENEKD